MAQKRNKKVAVVQCLGGCHAEAVIPRGDLAGDCSQVLADHPDGILKCKWGCLGMGSCVTACKMDAIHINGLGIADVDRGKCVGCGLCVKACPLGLIRITTPEYPVYTACMNQDGGAQTRKDCSVGCIACGICVKNCPADAVRIDNNHAVIDEAKCIACGMCAVKCPRGIILDADGIFTVKAQRQEE